MKRVNCKYAKHNYVWIDTEEPGLITKEDKAIVTDHYGFWHLNSIECLACTDFGTLPFFWCRNPERCSLREEGEGVSSFCWTAEYPKGDGVYIEESEVKEDG